MYSIIEFQWVIFLCKTKVRLINPHVNLPLKAKCLIYHLFYFNLQVHELVLMQQSSDNLKQIRLLHPSYIVLYKVTVLA